MESTFWTGIGLGFVLSVIVGVLDHYYRARKQWDREKDVQALRSNIPALIGVTTGVLLRIIVASFVANVLIILLFASRGEHRLAVGLTGLLAPDVVEGIEMLVIALMSGTLFLCCYVIAIQGSKLAQHCRRLASFDR